VPIAAADALAWAEGRLDDYDLILFSPLVPEAVYIVHIPSLAVARECFRQVAYWRDHGAVCLIARSSEPGIDHHFEKADGKSVYRETINGRLYRRWFLEPEAFKVWLARFTKSPEPHKP